MNEMKGEKHVLKKDTANGGTLISCVWFAVYPSVATIEGRKLVGSASARPIIQDIWRNTY